MNGVPFTGLEASGLHVNAYLGDVTGNGSIDGLPVKFSWPMRLMARLLKKRILKGTMPAGSKRRFRVVPADSSSASGGSQTPPKLSERNGLLTLELGGKPVLVYHEAVAEPPSGLESVYRRSGFIHPLMTRSGVVVTDDFPPDHAHQHGVFMAWVNCVFEERKIDFWNQLGRTAKISHLSGPRTSVGPVFADVRVRNTLRH